MVAHHENRCSQCNQITDPLRLYVKRITFGRKNQKGIVRTRTVLYLCDVCVELDPDWNFDPANSPGHTSAARKRIQARREGRQ